MSDFSVFNTWDGTTKVASSGDLLTFEVGSGAMLVVHQLLDQPDGETNTAFATGIVGTQSSGVPLAGSTLGQEQFAVALTVLDQTASGVYYAGLTVMNNAVQSIGFKLNYHAPNNPLTGVGSLIDGASALPEDVIDLACNLRTRALQSSILPLTTVKAGGTYKFGVIPSRDTTGFIDSGITKITLAMRPTGKFTGDPLEFDADVSPSSTGSGAGKHYPLTVNLDDDALTRWFSDANAAAEGGDATAVPTKVTVDAELKFEESAVITISRTFQFDLYQSVVAPSP